MSSRRPASDLGRGRWADMRSLVLKALKVWWVASLPQALLRGKGVLHFGGDPTHRYVFHLAGRRWTLDPDHGWRGEPARSRVVLIGPNGSFDPALLDMTIAQCAARATLADVLGLRLTGALTASGVPRVRAVLVHLYTASGVLLAFLATAEICSAAPDPRVVFALLALAVLVDATDGPLARRWEVKRVLPAIEGRTIDDIVDYLTYTFVPLLLVWRMGWVPEPAAVWIAPALLASLFGFANTGIKDESGGFFLGFPSYWNVVAFYAGLVSGTTGPGSTPRLLLLALATVLPSASSIPTSRPTLADSGDPGRAALAAAHAGDAARLRATRRLGPPGSLCSILSSTSGCPFA